MTGKTENRMVPATVWGKNIVLKGISQLEDSGMGQMN
jgi:hypothetical protein